MSALCVIKLTRHMKSLRILNKEQRAEGILLTSLMNFCRGSVFLVATPFIREQDAMLSQRDLCELNQMIACAKENQL